MKVIPGCLALLLAIASVASASPTSPGTPEADRRSTVDLEDAWRGAQWGMTVDEVLKALRPRAYRITPELAFPDGSVVAVGLDSVASEGLTFDVRFLFRNGRLALVSLRTGQKTYAAAESYDRLRQVLATRWGAPVEDAKDDEFIDMRQARWDRGADRVDLKYIPGVVALLRYPRPPAAEGPR
jgi:hypothetical protein